MYFSEKPGSSRGTGKKAWKAPTGSEMLTFDDFKHKVGLFGLVKSTRGGAEGMVQWLPYR